MGDGTVVEEMDLRPGGTYRFRTAYGVVEGEFREVEPPARLVQRFQNHLQPLEFEDLRVQTKLTQTRRGGRERGLRARRRALAKIAA
ncbi:MAG: SRPBCC domain-containing protein [Gaiellaceae bacterium]